MTNQSPAPVAGAVEAFVSEAKLALGIALDSAESCGHALAGAMSRRRAAEDKEDAIAAIDRLAALHPQPAPAAAVEAERELFEAKFPRPAGVEWIGDGYEVKDSYANSYACDRYIPRWTTWLAARTAPAVAESQWMPIDSAPKDPRDRILLRWLSGGSNWICIGSWASTKDSPRLIVKGCPREGWMPDAGTCIPINQKDCVGWMPLPTVGSGSAQEGQAK